MMEETAHIRPDPDTLLRQMKMEEERRRKGRLKIFFGMCAGVGKTYDMLLAAHDARSKGIDAVIGYVETHGRTETEALVARIPIVPRKQVEYRGTMFTEMDLDAILERHPKLVLVDELAHTNIPGSRHLKRYQDVLEILENGIDVYTTLNVQHLESRADTVAQITGSVMRETVPDSIFEQADDVAIVDIPPGELLKRLAEGKVYSGERSAQAIQNFFKIGHLTALREMSLRLTAERVDHQLRDYMRTERIDGPWKSGQRIIVGISPSPQSIRLIRWARRMAYTMDATWVAVYVETSAKVSAAAREQLDHNLKLARELGAEIVATADQDIVAALLRVARQQNASQILIGKASARWRFFGETILDRLIDRSGDLDVYVVGGDDEEQGRRRITLPRPTSGITQYILSAAAILLSAAIIFPIRDLVGYQAVSFILLFIVSLLPLRMGYGPVLLAAGLGAVVWDFFFIPPIFTFSVGRLEDRLMLVFYFIVAIVTGFLSARSRAQERTVRSRESSAIALYTLTKDLAVATTQAEVVRAAVQNLRRFFSADTAIYLGDADGDMAKAVHAESSFLPDEKEFAVAAWSYWNEKKAGKGTDTLPAAAATYYPMSGPRYPLGVIGVRIPGNNPLPVEQDTLLENFIKQIASTLDREMLHEVTNKAIVVQESERLYRTLFNSISHELRTPIATIMGSSESLLHGGEAAQDPMLHELVYDIHLAAERLNRLVGNLLNMTRIESGLIKPALDWSDLHDLVSGALRNLEHEFHGRRISVNIAPDVPLVRLDFGLIQQAMVNILHNISEYTPSGSPAEIEAKCSDGSCTIEITDHGPGLPAESLGKIFGKFYRVPGSKAGGTGLGLSIARGFVEAHHGTIEAQNIPEGGLRVIIRLPVESSPAEPQ
jgi:two-component system, OmpR family, sensor histidine kinase KdpD